MTTRTIDDFKVLSRKKKVRAGNRASASRAINQVYDLLDDLELNQSKLKQSHQALIGKLAVFD